MNENEYISDECISIRHHHDTTHVIKCYSNGYNGFILELGDKTKWTMYQTSEEAGEAVYEYFKDLAKNDEQEFMTVINNRAQMKQSLDKLFKAGKTEISDEWLALWKRDPIMQWAVYEPIEYKAQIYDSFRDKINFTKNDVVLYRIS